MKKINYYKFRKQIENSGKSYFTFNELNKFYKNKKSSLKNLLSRWSKEELIFRLGKGYYCFDITKLDYLNLACNIIKPSYVSFEYALNYYGIIDQISQAITLTTVSRHKYFHLGPYTCEYTKLNKDLFFGYEKVDNYYIASPEKALLDTIYLTSRNKRLIDFDSLNLKRLNKKRLFRLLNKFPNYVKESLKKLL